MNNLPRYLTTAFSILLVPMLLLPGQGAAQLPARGPVELRFDHISLQHGLSQSTINGILQDSQGFMWFATQDGLNRYDGYGFAVYRNDPADAATVSDNWIYQIYEDSEGNLWICTHDGGLNMYDRRRESFTRYTHDPRNAGGVSRDNVTSIVEDPPGALWIGTWGGGLDRFDRRSGTWTHYRHIPGDPASLSDNRILALLVDRKGTLWVGTWRGLNRYNGARDSFDRFLPDPSNPATLSDERITKIYEDDSGTIWIGTLDAGMNSFDPALHSFTRYTAAGHHTHGLAHDGISSFAPSSSGGFWIGTTEGALYRYDHSAGRCLRYSARESVLTHSGILSLYEDNTQTLWIGTFGNGLLKYDPRRHQFTHHSHESDNPHSLSDMNVRAILEDRGGDLWVGTLSGLNRQGPLVQGFARYMHDGSDPNSLSNDKVNALIEDRRGFVWVGTQRGLNLYDPVRKRFTKFFHDPRDHRSLAENNVMALHQDRRGTLWVGTFSAGLDRYDPRTNTFSHYRNDPRDSASLSGDNVWCIYEDRSGMLWVGTWGRGLNRFDRATGKAVRYLRDASDPRSLSDNTVWAIHEDARGDLWLGTWGGGLNHYRRATNDFENFTERDGLPNNVVYGILEDDEGNLWLSTNKGISRLDPRARTFKNFDVEDGLQSNEFNQGAFCRRRSGELLFGGISGMNSFFPGRIRGNTHVPPVVATSFRVLDRPVKLGFAGSSAGDVVLSHAENYFSIEFVALDFAAPTKNQYAYMLEGFDAGWIFSGTRRYASYTNIEPGRYTFRVKGANSDGLWNEAGMSLTVVIQPPFWRTWWFRGIAVACLAGIAVVLYRYRIAKLLEIERVRVRIASDLHDDIGSTLTKIALYADLLKDNPDKQANTDLIGRIGSMSREIVTTMSDVVWSIDARTDTLSDLVDRMREFTSSIFSSGDVDVQFLVDAADPGRKLPLDVRQNVYLVFKEAVNNISKHACATAASISLRATDRMLLLSIKDNGRGLVGSTRKTGQGLRNMRMRADRIRAVLDVIEKDGLQITLTVRID